MAPGEQTMARTGIGKLVYNPPNVVHAIMRSADQLLPAAWFLWTGQTDA